MTPQQRLSEIEARLQAATPYEEKVGAKCPECNFETWGYRHWNGCELLDKHDNVLKNAPADLEWLTASLREALECLAKYAAQDDYYGRPEEAQETLASIAGKAGE